MNLRHTFAALCLISSASSASAQSQGWKSEDITLDALPAPLFGTLTVPDGKARVPLVILIAGSGPTDRNGNSPPGMGNTSNSYQLLADGLAAKGIATLRYDKRGIAASRGAMTKEADLRFDTYANDAVAWGKKYRGDARFSIIVIVGHSEGSLLGMLASQRLPADAYVSIAGPARRADKVLHDQFAALPPAQATQADFILSSLVAGRTVDSLPTLLAPFFRPSVQPYLISWFKYDGSTEIAKLRIPVLIVQGTTDIQVAPFEADSLKRALPSAQLLKIEGMNHVLKHYTGDPNMQRSTYADSTLPVVPELIDGIAKFILDAAAKSTHR